MTWHKKDPVMKALVKALPEPPSRKKKDLYLALVKSITSQQLSTKAADTIFKRVCALFEDNYPAAETLIEMEIEELRAAGLSNAKANYIKNIAAFHLEFPITNRHLNKLSDEDIVAHLTQIKGVGKWTVQMLLMFAMDRPDVFPVDDLVIRQTMVNLYGLTETGPALHKRLHEISESWRPNRTLASRYLWHARGAKLA